MLFLFLIIVRSIPVGHSASQKIRLMFISANQDLRYIETTTPTVASLFK
jgi:hypothetical protein